MNNAHLHLVVNHLPIIFPLVGVIILLVGIFSKSEVSKSNAYFIFVLGAIASIVAMATGECAEKAVEHLAGVSESSIETHEKMAETFSMLSYLLGGISIFSLVASFKDFSASKITPFVTLIVAGLTLFFAQKAGNTGGQIRHIEIQCTTQTNELKENEKAEHSQNFEKVENAEQTDEHHQDVDND